MKKLLLIFGLGLVLNGCTPDNHYHDGKYHTEIDVFGVSFAKIDYELYGSQVTINNSVSGISKLRCQQYEDRIEYIEKDGTTKILPVLENGDIQLNDQIILRKVKN